MADRKKEYVFFVKHPDHTTVPVIAENWEQATVKAADFWGVRWGKVAALCECDRKWDVHRCICTRCGKTFHGAEALCSACTNALKNEEYRRREYMKSGGWQYLPKKGLQVKMI